MCVGGQVPKQQQQWSTDTSTVREQRSVVTDRGPSLSESELRILLIQSVLDSDL